MSQTIVHEGRVYVVNYDETGKAEKLQEVGEGESVSTQRETLEASQAPEEMGWMDQFFYGMMMKFIPLGVRTFKRQIWKPAQNIKKPIFTHFYKQDDFQEHILNTMLPVLGSNVQTLQAQIDEQGFHVYSIFNFKFISVTVLGLGKLLANEDGQLILKLDHVKVGKIYLPKWLLKRVEKNFNLAAYSEESSEEVPIDILSMQYQAGGISIRCRKNLFQATAVAQG